MPPKSVASDASAEVSKSGITTSAAGARVIPASTRADGSQRREIRVRPGYRPPEDVEVYKNRTAEAWKNRGGGGVPGAEGLEDDERTAPSVTVATTKNAKRREARKKAKAAKEEGGEEEAEGQSAEVNGEVSAVTAAPAKEPSAEDKDQAEQQKKIKRLKKKLREARELQEKKEKGEGLLQEQFDKVIKIRELMRDLEKLGVQDEEEPGANPDIKPGV